MAGGATSRSWLIPVIALFASTFAIGTAELIVLGLLPTLAADLAVDIPTAGLLVTGYAIGVAVASPLLALLTVNLPRRSLLIAVMMAFVVGNALCAISTVYWMLLAARLIVAGCHGILFGVAMVLAIRLAPEGRQTSAVSLIVAGVTLSTIFGVPIGTAIGNAFGWRATFWFITGIGAVATLILALLIPRADAKGEARSSIRAEIGAAFRPVVILCFAIITCYMIGVFSLFTYLVPLLTTVSGVPLDYVPWVLFGMGFVGFFGNLIGGRLGDWNISATMVSVIAIVIVLLVILSQVATLAWGTVIVLWLIWFVGFGFPAQARSRILKATNDAPNFVSTLVSTAFNVGIAIGAAIGGAAVAAGWSYASLPLISAVGLGFALIGSLVLFAHDRRPVPVATSA